VLFVYCFNFNSTAIRKKILLGELEAFQRAFPLPGLLHSLDHEFTRHPLSEHVALLIKIDLLLV